MQPPVLTPSGANDEQTKKKKCVKSPDLEFSPKASPSGVGRSVTVFCAKCESSLRKNSKAYNSSEVREVLIHAAREDQFAKPVETARAKIKEWEPASRHNSGRELVTDAAASQKQPAHLCPSEILPFSLT